MDNTVGETGSTQLSVDDGLDLKRPQCCRASATTMAGVAEAVRVALQKAAMLQGKCCSVRALP